MCQCSRYYWVAEASARVCKLVRLRLSVVRDVEGALGAGRKGTSRAWALRVRWMPPHSRTRGTTCRQGGGKARKGRTACGHAPRRGRKGWAGRSSSASGRKCSFGEAGRPARPFGAVGSGQKALGFLPIERRGARHGAMPDFGLLHPSLQRSPSV